MCLGYFIRIVVTALFMDFECVSHTLWKVYFCLKLTIQWLLFPVCWVILIEMGAGETGPKAKRNLYKLSKKFIRGLGFQIDVLGSIPNGLRQEYKMQLTLQLMSLIT